MSGSYSSYRKENERNLKYFVTKWRENRKLTITQLRQLSKEIQESETCNWKGQVAYSGLGVVSGGLAIAGILSAPYTAGISLGLTASSGAFGTVSGLASIAHSVVNCNKVRSRREDAQKILERDKTCIDKLKKYIESKIQEYLIGRTDEASISYFEMVRLAINMFYAFQHPRALIAVMALKLDEAANILNFPEFIQKLIPGDEMVLIIDDAGVVKFAEATSIAGKEAAAKGMASTRFVQIASQVALPFAIFGMVKDFTSLRDYIDKVESKKVSDDAWLLMKVADELEDEMKIIEEKISKLLDLD